MINILNLLAENERLVADLYQAYAKLFPDYRDFFSGLAKDELQHASWIERLSEEAEKGSVTVDLNRFKKETLAIYRDYLSQEIRNAGGKGAALANALGTTLYIETSLIEMRFLQIFQAEKPEPKKILAALEASMKEHLAKAKKIQSGRM